MRIGPITIQWTKRLTKQAHEAQTLDLRRNRCIAGQSHDIQALRRTVVAMRRENVMLERVIDGNKLSQQAKRERKSLCHKE